MLGLVGVLTAAICSGCVDQQVPTGSRNPSVPATAPDSIPRTLINTFALLTDKAGNNRRSELVVLSFHEGTSQAARQKAISSVGGVVVGGKAGTQMEGWYIVRVASATTVAAIDSVMSVLRSHAVGIVFPFTVGFPNDQTSPRPSDGAIRTSADRVISASLAEQATSELRVRPSLLTQGTKQSPVPATPPDSTPAFASDPASIVKLPTSRIAWVRDLLVVQFAAAATQLHKDSIISSVSGVVVGGKPSSMEGGGFYFVRLPADTTDARLTAAESALPSSPLVRRAVRYFSMDLDPTFGVANDGPSRRKARGRVGAQKPAVPARAPDSLPTSLIHSLPLLTDQSGNQHRSQLVMLSFFERASQPARQAAIRSVGGMVVGGVAGIQEEGWYLVRIASATSMTAIDSVVAELGADPSVELVGPYTLGFPDDASGTAQRRQVPSVAPDTLPAFINSLPSLTDSANRTLKAEIVVVKFHEGTSQSLRQRAVDAVSGQVIGGSRVPKGEGVYYLRIRTATTARRLHTAADVLDALPQVAVVYLLDAAPQEVKVFTRGTKQSAVPAMAPDSVPFSTISRLFYPADGGWPYAQDVLMLRFRLGTPVAERTRVIGLVSGTVIGGKRDVTAEGGVYVIGLPRDSTQATLLAARDVLRAENAVLTVWLYDFVPLDPTNGETSGRE
jgi:hypothetical protein